MCKKIAKISTPIQTDLQRNLSVVGAITRVGFSFRAKTNSEIDLLMDYFSILVMLPFLSYHFILKKLATHGEEAKEVWRLLGEVESAIAILNFRKVLPITSQPTISDKLEVVGEAVYHPLLEMPVTNGVSWRKNTVVTGSNASGKSTYVKSVAISCWFSLAIHTALATKFQLPFAHLMTSMNSEDNLFEGDSYFMTEINSLHRMVKKISTSEPCLCFIDEILKGTNTIERIAASSNVIYWMNQRPSLTFVATHDSELTEILGAVCHNIHFTEQVTQDDGLTFDYRVKEGPAISRNALKLLHVTGYPCEIIEAAQQSADFFEKNHYWDKKFTAKNN